MNRRTNVLFRTLMFAFVLVSAVPIVQAQFKAGIQGTVTDTTGGLVPEAKVTLTNNETSRSQDVIASGDGFYRFSGLPPGEYTLEVEKTGYKKKVLENVAISAEAVRGIDVELEAGDITASVVVSDETAPLLETENANIGKGITNREVLQLPQVGRDPYELARLAPGVFGTGGRDANGGAANLPNTSGPSGSNVSVFQTENRPAISANGQRVSSNNFQIDGVSVNSQTWGGAAVITPSQESVKEVQVLSSTYSAEDGRNSGANVKVVTQNGTNDFHGSAFFKYDTPAWNAFNRFNGTPGFVKPAQRVGQRFKNYGGSIGGPIIENKLFFFFSYEGTKNSNNTPYEGLVESPELRQLIATARPNSIAARILGTSGIEPRIVQVLNRTCATVGFDGFWFPNCQSVGNGFDVGSLVNSVGVYVPVNPPAPNSRPALDGIPDFQWALFDNPSRFSGNQFFNRVDWAATDKDDFAFSAFFTPTSSAVTDTEGQSRPIGDIISERLNWSAAVIYNRTISATMLNEARFNITRWGFNEVESNPDANFSVPRISIEHLLANGKRIRFGFPRFPNTPANISETQLDFRDILTILRGNHSVKFGGELRQDRNFNTEIGAARPLYSFSRPWNFANDTPIFEEIAADAEGNPRANDTGFKSNNVAFFVQDDWKVRPNLTLNLGLRWEYFPPISASGGQTGKLGNIVLGPNGLVDAKVVEVDKLYDSDYNNFGPQIGVAWSPKFANDKLVMRGGFGIGYDRLAHALLANARRNPPNGGAYGICCGTAAGTVPDEWGDGPFANNQITYALGTSNSILSYPRHPGIGGGFNPTTGGPNRGTVEIYGSPQDLPTTQIYRYSLEGQYELPMKLTATLGYQGSQGKNLVRIVNQGIIEARQNPTFNPVFLATPDSESKYNAMLVRLQRRYANGVQFDFNYRFSASKDNVSFEAPCGCTNQTFPWDNSTEYGPSDFDVKHYFVGSAIWDLPIFRNQTDWAGKILGGWQISTIITGHTGFPWTPVVSNGLGIPGAPFANPVRPIATTGREPLSNTNSNFLQAGGIFPGGGPAYFSTAFVSGNNFDQNRPAIGRNSFRGPKYFSTDMSLVKRFGLPNLGALGEKPSLDLRFNFFNVFNKLNLAPFGFGSDSTRIDNPRFGTATDALAGRVVEFQARFSF